jgi:hypothetical protein
MACICLPRGLARFVITESIRNALSIRLCDNLVYALVLRSLKQLHSLLGRHKPLGPRLGPLATTV